MYLIPAADGDAGYAGTSKPTTQASETPLIVPECPINVTPPQLDEPIPTPATEAETEEVLFPENIAPETVLKVLALLSCSRTFFDCGFIP